MYNIYFNFINLQGKFRPKIEMLDESDSENSDAEEEEPGSPDIAESEPAIEQTKMLIQEVDTESQGTSRQMQDEYMKKTIAEQRTNMPPSKRDNMLFDIKAEEEKYKKMSVDEKIQDLAENLGSSKRSVVNTDLWSPDDDLD